jgi:eukaryotic-like serine/threonine-protein kinase
VTFGSHGDMIADRYRLQRPIGSGGYGEVWNALDTHRGYEVALKFVLTRDRRATWREATMLTALESEHILEVNNADMVGDVPYLDTALAACSLDKLAMPFGAEPGVAVDWIRRALRGLDLCHHSRLLHRDVKPQNIFLTSSGDAKLGDFGVAILMERDGTAEPAGDPQIQAPEFFTGGRATIASDIYAAACSLYALLTGRFPYAGIRLQSELEAAIIAGGHAPVRALAPHVSQALADKVKIGMAIDPSARFGSAAAFDTALALPRRARRFAPTRPHTGHSRCWTVTGSGEAMQVCVLPAASTNRVSVETRYQGSGNRIRRHCLETTERQLPSRLRQIFNDLR